MRLFIGIKTGCERYFLELLNQLKIAGHGCFSDIENLHITLRFLGEMQQNKIKMVCDVLSVIQNRVFELECNGIGIFDGKDIVFAKLGGDLQDLFLLYEKIENALEKICIPKEKRPFRPHITLARYFQSTRSEKADFESLMMRKCRFTVKDIILFESRRIQNKLSYIPLYKKTLFLPER